MDEKMKAKESKALELTDEEIEKAAGGKDTTLGITQCQNCKRAYSYHIDQPIPHCPYCGFDPNSQSQLPMEP